MCVCVFVCISVDLSVWYFWNAIITCISYVWQRACAFFSCVCFPFGRISIHLFGIAAHRVKMVFISNHDSSAVSLSDKCLFCVCVYVFLCLCLTKLDEPRAQLEIPINIVRVLHEFCTVSIVNYSIPSNQPFDTQSHFATRRSVLFRWIWSMENRGRERGR